MKRFTPKPRTVYHRGVTLIELLAVIAVLGVLSAILIPVTLRIRESANNSRCLNNLRQLGIASRLFSNEEPIQANPRTTHWLDDLLIYLEYPEGVTTLGDLMKLSAAEAQKHVLWCPSVDYSSADPIVQRDNNCYGINTAKFSTPHVDNPEKDARTIYTTSEHPSEIIAFLDANNRNVTHSTPARIGTGRHGDNVNVVFADGHTESIPYTSNGSGLDEDWLPLFNGPE